MKRRPSLSRALLAWVAASALVVTGCSTVKSRIDENRTNFDRLSASDKALVTEGKIRGGMSQEAVYIAWGRPEQKAVGEIHGVPTETWVYLIATTTPYGYGYGYGGGFYGGGFSGPVGYYGRHGGRRFYGAFYDPFYDPYYYPFAQTVTQPVKTVSFQRGRVIAFQYLSPAY
ncbi:MAG: hypothetical protein H0X40_12115 [Chthoniobacterales bacterium]|nr:hypothetical protein [Chthoniobacterales bacterium]